jgi:ABC-type nitrate/sulfonate/bicarbonate transport system substrate-binding protein
MSKQGLRGFSAMLVLVAAVIASSAPAATAPRDQLSINISTLDPAFAPLYLAQTMGAFARVNLDVKIVVAGSATQLPLLVSGGTDIAMLNAAAVLGARLKGADLTMIHNFATNSGGAYLVAAKPGIKTIKDCTRTGTLAVLSTVYNNTVRYKKDSGASYSIVLFSDYGTLTAALLSGNVDCAVESFAAILTSINSGSVHLIVDPRVPSTVPGYKAGAPSPYASNLGATIVGVQSHLKENRSKIVRFLRALQSIIPVLRTSSNARIAGLLKQSSDFDLLSRDSISQAFAAYRSSPYWLPETPTKPAGYLPSSVFEDSLAYFKDGGLTGDLSSPVVSYANSVDMSYYKEAVVTPLVGTVSASGTLTLTAAGKRVTSLKPGIFSVTVKDASAKENFHLVSRGVNRSSSVTGKSTTTWYLTLAAGKLTFASDHSKQGGTVKVAGAYTIPGF